MISLHEVARKQLLETDRSIRLIILHPNYSQQHRLLQHLLDEKTPVYAQLTGKDMGLDDIQQQVVQAADIQTDGGLGEADCLIIDEGDRANANALNAYLQRTLLDESHLRVLLMTRIVPHTILEDDSLRRQARFIPVEPSLMLWDYAQIIENGETLLEVRALGPGRVLLNGRLVQQWDGILPRALFFYFVDRGMTTRNDIFTTFWPNLTTREATNVFHVTKRKISEVLGVDLTRYGSGFYHLSSDINLSYDTALFNEAVQNSAVVEKDESIALMQRAVEFYRGDYLTSLNSLWVSQRREELQQDYGETLVTLARTLVENNEHEQALSLYLRAATVNRLREDIAEGVMSILNELDLCADALTYYQRLQDDLQSELGIQPNNRLKDLAQTIEQTCH